MKPGDSVVARFASQSWVGVIFAIGTDGRIHMRTGPHSYLLTWPENIVGVVRDASDVPPYTGPSRWREVAWRMCVCGFHAVLHRPTPLVWWARGHYVMMGLCSSFRNAAVGR